MLTSTRNTLCILFLLLCTQLVKAQVLQSGFEDAVPPNPPPDWTKTNTGSANWQSLQAGVGETGNAYEGRTCMFLADFDYAGKSDAWLAAPAYSFEAGKKYSISFYYKNQSANFNSLQLTLGTGTAPASQTNVLWENTFNNTAYAKAQINFTATETGTRYVAIHANTDTTYTYVYIDNFRIASVDVFEPLNPTISSIGLSTATATWSTVPGAASYEYGVSTSASTAPSSTSFATDTTAAITGLQNATSYYFYVRTIAPGNQHSDWAVKSFATAYNLDTTPVLSCGSYYENSFVGGFGIYNMTLCDYQPTGKEFFHKFIPTNTGYYNLNAYAVNTGQTVIYAYKDSADGSGPDGWACIGNTSLFGGAKYTFGPLQAGRTYYIMEKNLRPVTLGTYYAYSIDCYATPPPNDSCQNATDIISAQYNDTCTGTSLTTAGTPAEDPGIWVKFKATDDAQLFRFKDMVYSNGNPATEPGLTIEIYNAPCGTDSYVDFGQFDIAAGGSKDIYSYKLHKDSTYYCHLYATDRLTTATFSLCIMKLGVTPGDADNCLTALPYTVNNATDDDNTSTWVPLTDDSYKMVGEINASSNNLNKVQAGVFVHDGAVRQDDNGVFYANRNFTFGSGKAPLTPVKVRLFITNAELDSLQSKDASVASVQDLRITVNSDKCSSKLRNTPTEVITPYASGDYDANHKFIEFETGTLASFYLRGNGSVLPATIISFTGAQVSNAIQVNWKIAQETNVKNYILERSSDAVSFTQVGVVKATGNNNQSQAYYFTDNNVSEGKYYYRFITVNNDGSQMYSNIITILFKGGHSIVVTPNPFKDKIILSTNQTAVTKYEVTVTDINGKTILAKTITIKAGTDLQNLYLPNVPAGLYILKATSATSTDVVKIIKE